MKRVSLHTRLLAISVSISLVIAISGGTAYLLFWKAPADTAHTVARLISNATQTKVTIGTEVVLAPTHPITELATATREFEMSYTYDAEYLGSVKRLEMKGYFVAKAGFTVDESFSTDVSEDGKTVTLRHKEPELLSCELTKHRVIRDENGWWNKLQPVERESALNELIRKARTRALDDDMRNKATENLLERIAPLQQRFGFSTSNEIVS